MGVDIGPFPNGERKRRIHVRIDKFDSWSADHTLALIVEPLLKQLEKTKHGAPDVDDADVPKKLRWTKAERAKYNKDGWTNKRFFKRWDWILAEMIWSMNEIAQDNPGEERFHSGVCDWKFEKVEGSDLRQMVKGPRHTYKLDRKGHDAYHERIKHGTALFGKYFQALWD